MKVLMQNQLLSQVVGVVGLSAIAFFGVTKPVDAASLGQIDVGARVKTQVFNKLGNTTGTFKTEMLELELEPIEINGVQALIRENPHQASTGETTITEIENGQYRIDSFFDIFTQISLDGGNEWIDAEGSTRVQLAPTANPQSLGVITSNPSLPPDVGGYWAQQHARYRLPGVKDPVALAKLLHFGFFQISTCSASDNVRALSDSADEIHCFQSRIKAEIETVPEPTTMLGASLAFGVGTFFLNKSARKSKKQALS